MFIISEHERVIYNNQLAYEVSETHRCISITQGYLVDTL